MFGYKKVDMEGKNVSMLMPQPFRLVPLGAAVHASQQMHAHAHPAACACRAAIQIRAHGLT